MKWLVVLSLSALTCVGCASPSASNGGRVQDAQHLDPVTRANEGAAGDPTGFGMEGTFHTDRTNPRKSGPAERNLSSHAVHSKPVERDIDHDADGAPGM